MLVGNIDIDRLSEVARLNFRCRKNLNVHGSYNEKCQRFFNAIEPNSYIRPHRHSHSEGGETLLAVRGGFVLVIFKEGGELDKFHPFGVGSKFQAESLCVTIPDGSWHTVVAIYPGSVLFEVKAGPFIVSCSKEVAPWAPLEETEEGLLYHRKLCLDVFAWLGIKY